MKTKFSGKRPVMFYQDGKPNSSFATLHGSRVRIFYPGGKTEWGTLSVDHDPETSKLWFGLSPCWTTNKQPKSMKEAIEMANEYDRVNHFPEMEFLGEL